MAAAAAAASPAPLPEEERGDAVAGVLADDAAGGHDRVVALPREAPQQREVLRGAQRRDSAVDPSRSAKRIAAGRRRALVSSKMRSKSRVSPSASIAEHGPPDSRLRRQQRHPRARRPRRAGARRTASIANSAVPSRTSVLVRPRAGHRRGSRPRRRRGSAGRRLRAAGLRIRSDRAQPAPATRASRTIERRPAGHDSRASSVAVDRMCSPMPRCVGHAAPPPADSMNSRVTYARRQSRSQTSATKPASSSACAAAASVGSCGSGRGSTTAPSLQRRRAAPEGAARR